MRVCLITLLLGFLVGCASAMPTPVDIGRSAAGAWEVAGGHSSGPMRVVNTGLAWLMVPLYTAIYPALLPIEGYVWYRQNVVDYCLYHACSTPEILYDENGNVIGEIY